MATTTPNYEIDPKDPKLQEVKTWNKTSTYNSDAMYDRAHNAAQDNYENSRDSLQDWEKIQKENQQKQTDFTIEKINQQKEQAKTDFQKEASAAYVDYQKQINPYGAEAEQRAAMGMTNTGYSESSLVNMYNQYQIRYTAARELFQKAVMNFENQITEAKLANDAALAKIGIETMQAIFELDAEWMAQSLSITEKKAQAQRDIQALANDKYKTIYDLLMQENILAEEARNNSLDNDIAQQQIRIEKDKFEYQKQQDNAAKSGKTVVYRGRTNTPNGKKTSNKSAISRMNNNNVQPKSDSAVAYFNKLIASGADKDKVSNEIAIALREGVISKEEAAALRKKFTPRGVQY